MNICPQCGYHNRLGVLICEDCGSSVFDDVFTKTRRITRDEEDPMMTAPLHQTGPLVQAGEIVLTVQDAGVIRARLETAMVLGRMNRHSPDRPDIDLTRFHAFEKGVSTSHALLGCEDGVIKIADLGSTNGTFLNGKKLLPHQSYALYEGDEIRLAQMYLMVSFEDVTEQVRAE